MIYIYSIHYNKPEFIELQKKSFDRFTQGYEFVIIDNSIDSEVSSAIGKVCSSLGLSVVGVPNRYDSRKDRFHGLSHETGVNCFLNLLKKNHDKEDIVMLLDHDVFLISDMSKILEIAKKSSVLTIKQRVDHIYYLWPGLTIFNLKNCPDIEEISLNGCEKNGNSWIPIDGGVFTDVGGHSYHYLRKYEKEIELIDIREYFVEGTNKINEQHVFYHFLAGSQWNGGSNSEWRDKFHNIEKIIFQS